jgi:hypothetical protein
MSTLEDLAGLLSAGGVGEIGEYLFLAKMPDSPDDIMVLTPYAGDGPEYVQNSFVPIAEYPRMQVVTRSQSYTSAEEKAYRAWALLAGVTNAQLGATRYRSIRPMSSPALLGRDSEDRVKIYFNVTIEKEITVGS